MRDLINSRFNAIQERTSKLHANLDAAIRSECGNTPAVPKQRRRIVGSGTVAPGSGTRDTRIGTDVIGMAYRALTSDPTLRLTGKDIQAAHIATWIDSEYCTTVEVADIQVAMVAYSHTR